MLLIDTEQGEDDVKAIDFSHVPAIYWSDNIKISYLQRRIIIYSIMYYELNESVVSDKEYDIISKQLVSMMNEATQDELEKTQYWYCMSDFDGSTGFDLYGKLSKKDREYLTILAKHILKRSKGGN